MSSVLKFGKSGQTLVIVHSAESPTDLEWDVWIERMGQDDYKNILISSLGGGPTAKQRRKTNKFWRGRRLPRFAVVTTSRFVVGTVAAFNWFLDDQLKPFHPDNIRAALDYIEVPQLDRAALLAFVNQLHQQIERRAA